MLKDIRIQCSPLSGTIYAGRVNKAGDGWSGQKVDVTSDVLGAVIHKVGAGNVIVVNENGQPAYEIEVRRAALSASEVQPPLTFGVSISSGEAGPC